MGNFPNNFLWGAATSSHQVEGNNNLNDWWEWEQEGKASEHSNAACKHYSHFKEDFAIAKELNHNCHRFSLEWSRIEPEEGIINQEAISHYREVIQSLRSLNIEPIVTINHFSLPLWFYKKGGWENPDAPHIFAEFVKRIAREYGDMVSYWITINEPIVYAYQGYIISKWPPGKNDFSLCLRVIRNLILAHVLSYQAIHSQVKDSKVGLAKHAIVYEPCSRISLKDKLSVSLRSYITNHFFIKSIMKGKISLPRFFNEKR